MHTEQKHLKKILYAHDYKKIQQEIDVYGKIQDWSRNRSRIGVQKHTLSIDLRGMPKHLTVREGMDTQTDYLNQKTYPYFRYTYAVLESFALQQGGTLARAMIVSLAPHQQVYEHFDMGTYYACRDRYHLVVKSEGSKMFSGDETQIFHEGDLFWFDNKAVHRAENTGDSPRIHIIFDVLPGKSVRIRMIHFFEKLIALSRSSA